MGVYPVTSDLREFWCAGNVREIKGIAKETKLDSPLLSFILCICLASPVYQGLVLAPGAEEIQRSCGLLKFYHTLK